MKITLDDKNKVLSLSGEISVKRLKELLYKKKGWTVIAGDIVLVVKQDEQNYDLTPGAYQNSTGEIVFVTSAN